MIYLLTMDDAIDFGMFDLPTRPGCRAAEAPETDRLAKDLAGETEAAPFIAEAVGVA